MKIILPYTRVNQAGATLWREWKALYNIIISTYNNHKNLTHTLVPLWVIHCQCECGVVGGGSLDSFFPFDSKSLSVIFFSECYSSFPALTPIIRRHDESRKLQQELFLFGSKAQFWGRWCKKFKNLVCKTCCIHNLSILFFFTVKKLFFSSSS